MAAWGDRQQAFDLQAFLQAASIPPDQEAILESSQAWRPADAGDELQSVPQAVEPVAPAPDQQFHQGAAARPSVHHPLELFEGLSPSGGLAAPQVELSKWPVPEMQPQLEKQQQRHPLPAPHHHLHLPQQQQQQQTVSEAQRQVGELVGSLCDSPSIGALLPFPPPATAASLGDAEQQRLQQQPHAAREQAAGQQHQAAVIGQIDTARAAPNQDQPSHMDPDGLDSDSAAALQGADDDKARHVVEVRQPDVQSTRQAVHAAAAEAGPVAEQPPPQAPLTQQQQEQGDLVLSIAGALGPVPAEAVPDTKAERRELGGAAAACVRAGSQGEDDFQDAQEELPAAVPAAAPNPDGDGAVRIADGSSYGAPVRLGAGQPWAGARELLTQAPLSPGTFAFDTQLPSQLVKGSAALAAPPVLVPAGPVVHEQPAKEERQAAGDDMHQPALEVGQPAPKLQLQAHWQGAGEDSHSLQGSVEQPASSGAAGGNSVDSRGTGGRRRSGTWLLGSLGALAQAFKRNAAQAKQAPVPGAFLTQAATQLSPHQLTQLQGLSQQPKVLAQQQQQAAALRHAAAGPANQANSGVDGDGVPPASHTGQGTKDQPEGSHVPASSPHAGNAARTSNHLRPDGKGSGISEPPSATAWNARPAVLGGAGEAGIAAAAAAPPPPRPAQAATVPFLPPDSTKCAGVAAKATPQAAGRPAADTQLASAAEPVLPSRPAAALGFWSGETAGDEGTGEATSGAAGGSTDGAAAAAGLSAHSSGNDEPSASTPTAAQRKERRLSGGFLDILAHISSPKPTSNTASPLSGPAGLPAASSYPASPAAAPAATAVLALPYPSAPATLLEEPAGPAEEVEVQAASVQPATAAQGPGLAVEQVRPFMTSLHREGVADLMDEGAAVEEEVGGCAPAEQPEAAQPHGEPALTVPAAAPSAALPGSGDAWSGSIPSTQVIALSATLEEGEVVEEEVAVSQEEEGHAAQGMAPATAAPAPAQEEPTAEPAAIGAAVEPDGASAAAEAVGQDLAPPLQEHHQPSGQQLHEAQGAAAAGSPVTVGEGAEHVPQTQPHQILQQHAKESIPGAADGWAATAQDAAALVAAAPMPAAPGHVEAAAEEGYVPSAARAPAVHGPDVATVAAGAVVEGSPSFELLPTLLPPPSQWPESELREQVPPTPAGESQSSFPPPESATALPAALAGAENVQQQATATPTTQEDKEEHHQNAQKEAEPLRTSVSGPNNHPATESAPDRPAAAEPAWEAAGGGKEVRNREAALAAVLARQAEVEAALVVQQRMLVDALVGADPEDVAAVLAAEAQQEEEAQLSGGSAGSLGGLGGLGGAAALAAAVAAAAEEAGVVEVGEGSALCMRRRRAASAQGGDSSRRSSGRRDSGGSSFSFPTLIPAASDLGGGTSATGRPGSNMAGSKRPSGAAAASCGVLEGLLEAEPDVSELLLSSKRLLGEATTQVPRQRRRLGLQRLSEEEEQEEEVEAAVEEAAVEGAAVEEAAVHALSAAPPQMLTAAGLAEQAPDKPPAAAAELQAKAAEHLRQASTGMQTAATHAASSAAQPTIGACGASVGTQPVAVSERREAVQQAGWPQLKFVVSTAAQTATDEPPAKVDAWVQHKHRQLVGIQASAGTDTSDLPPPPLGAVGVQTSPSRCGRASAAVQATSPPPQTRSVSVQVHMVPKKTQPAAAAQAGSPQLAMQPQVPGVATAAAKTAAGTAAPTATALKAAAANGTGGRSRRQDVPGAVTSSRFGPRSEPPAARAVRRVREWKDDGMAVVHLPPGLNPTRVQADREGAAAAQQRLAEAVRHEAQDQEVAATEERSPQEQVAAEQLQWEQGAEAQQLQGQRQQKHKGRQAKAADHAAKHQGPAAEAPSITAPAATCALPAPVAAAPMAVLGRKRARSLGTDPAGPGTCSPMILLAQQKIRAAQLARQQPQQPAAQERHWTADQVAEVPAPAINESFEQQQPKRQRLTLVAALTQQEQHPQLSAHAQQLPPLTRPGGYSPNRALAYAGEPSLEAPEQRHTAGGWRPTSGPPPVPVGTRAAVPQAPAYKEAAFTSPHTAASQPMQQLQQEQVATRLTPQQIAQLPTRPNITAPTRRNPFMRH